jgi:thiamine biosynthesis lipoprotein
MKITKVMWDMPITVEIVDRFLNKDIFQELFSYFEHINSVFNTFEKSSEISRINRGEIDKDKWSDEMKEAMDLCEKTKKETEGYFEYKKNGIIDPLGIVKGWAIKNGSDILLSEGYKNFYIEAGGDIQAHGHNEKDELWKVGIRNPFKLSENVKIVLLGNCGIATSGNYIRGNHIYNPFNPKQPIEDIVSLSVIGKNVCEADRFATAAFAMGKEGIYFIENIPGLEGYMISQNGVATFTSGFENYALKKYV